MKKSFLLILVALIFSTTIFLGGCGEKLYLYQHQITFDSDGGSSVQSQFTNQDFKITKPTDPTKEGYTFLGWYVDNKKFDFDSEINVGTTLKAKWQANSYRLNFESENLDLSRFNKMQTYGEVIQLPAVETPNGYAPIWKYKEDNNQGLVIEEDDIFYGTTDKIICLTFSPITYKIIYETAGVDMPTPIRSVYNITSLNIDLSEITLQKPHYTFEGWYNSGEYLESQKITNIPTGSTGDITLYAKFAPIDYELTYVNTYSDFDNYSSTFNIETTNLQLPISTNPDLIIIGWYKTENFTGDPVTKINDLRLTDTTLYAKWKYINISNEAYFVNSPYTLQYIASDSSLWDKVFIQTRDIDCQHCILKSIGNKDIAFSGSYYGSLNGIQYKLSNVTHIKNSGTDESAGLFATTKNATLKDIHIDILTLTTNSCDATAGGLVGTAIETNINNCKIEKGALTIELTKRYSGVGGLVGRLSGGNLTNSSYNGVINIPIGAGTTTENTMYYYAGGLVGTADDNQASTPLIMSCSAECVILGKSFGHKSISYLGGLVGLLNNGFVVESCVLVSTLETTIPYNIQIGLTAQSYLGGLIGWAGDYGTTNTYGHNIISNCYSQATLKGHLNTNTSASYIANGGLVAGCTALNIKGSFFTGEIIRPYANRYPANAICQQTPTDTSLYEIRDCAYITENLSASTTINDITTYIASNWLDDGWEFSSKALPTQKYNNNNEKIIIDSLQDYLALQNKIIVNDIRLECDLNFTEIESVSPITAMLGKFDGNGHTISNITIKNDNAYACALINYAKGNLHDITINNLTIDNTKTYSVTGGLVAFSTGCIFEDCTITNINITSNNSDSRINRIGGLIGSASGKLNIYDCHIDTCNIANTITEDYSNVSIGGLVGSAQTNIASTISKSSVTNFELSSTYNIDDERYANLYAGGLVGLMKSKFLITNSIDNCYVNQSSITIKANEQDSDTSSEIQVGGFIGQISTCEISCCYADSDIICEGTTANAKNYAYCYVASFIGCSNLYSDRIYITNSYCLGKVVVNAHRTNYCSRFMNFRYITEAIITYSYYSTLSEYKINGGKTSANDKGTASDSLDLWDYFLEKWDLNVWQFNSNASPVLK